MSNANTIQLVLEVDDKGSAKVKAFSSTLTDQVKTINSQVKETGGAVDKVQSSCSALQGVVAKLATGFAAWKVGDIVKDSALLSARVETLGVVMHQVGQNALYSQSEMDGYAESVRKMGVTTQESRQTVTQMVQAHLDLAKASDLARVAQDAAVIGNTNSSESLRGLMHGIVTLQPEILRTYGIIVNFESEYAKFASSVGRTVESLSGQEKQQIALNAVLQAGAGIAGSYEAAMGTVGKQMTSLPRLIEEVKLQSGELFKPALTVLVQEFSDVLKEAGAALEEMKQSGQLDAWASDLATNMRDAIDKTISLAKGLRDVIDKVGPFATEAAKLLVLGYVAEKVWTLANNMGKLALVLKANKEVLAALVIYEAQDWLGGWLSGTTQIERETAKLTEELKRQKSALAEAEAAVRKKSLAEQEEADNIMADLRAKVAEQTTIEQEAQRKHEAIQKTQVKQDEEYLKKWEAMKDTIGMQAQEKDLARLSQEYAAYNRVVQDKVALERWYAIERNTLVASAAIKVAETDKKALESRLSDWQKYYDSLQSMIEKNADQQKKNIEELNALYQQQIDARKSGEALIRGLQEIGMSAAQKYESQKSALADQYTAAMQLSGQDLVKALEEYKQALASFGQSWSQGVTETTQNMLFGAQTSTLVSGKEIVSSVVSDIQAATQAQQIALDALAAEKEAQIRQDRIWGETLEQSAQEASVHIEELKGVVGELSAQIEAMQKTITITGDDQVSWVVDKIAQTLNALHDKTVYITTVYQSVGGSYSGNGIASGAKLDLSTLNLSAGASATPYALGTGYVPKTGMYLLHKGEAVTPQAQTSNRSSLRVENININVPESAAPQRPEDWREITRQYIVPELEKVYRA